MSSNAYDVLTEATNLWIERARGAFNQQFDTPRVYCNIRGRIAGKAYRSSRILSRTKSLI